MDDKATVDIRFADHSGITFEVPAKVAKEIAYMVTHLRTDEASLTELLQRRVFSRRPGE